MPAGRELYRAISSAFPTGVCVLTTRDADGSPRGLTTQSYVGVSTEPPLVLMSVDRSSRTLDSILGSGAFVVNFLRAGAEDLSTLFASKADDKFADIRWVPSAVARGAPILAEHSVAYAECLLDRSIEAGDHTVLLGVVEGGALQGGTPLLYFRRTYAAWPEERPAPSME